MTHPHSLGWLGEPPPVFRGCRGVLIGVPLSGAIYAAALGIAWALLVLL